MAWARSGTSRTTLYGAQSVVPLMGRSCMLSKAREGPDGPSIRIHNPAHPDTSRVFAYAVNRSLLPRYLMASNLCMRVPKPLGFVATHASWAALFPVWAVASMLTAYSVGLSPASTHPAGMGWLAGSIDTMQKASVGAELALISVSYEKGCGLMQAGPELSGGSGRNNSPRGNSTFDHTKEWVWERLFDHIEWFKPVSITRFELRHEMPPLIFDLTFRDSGRIQNVNPSDLPFIEVITSPK